ncbi:hypothetical protein [Fodinibius sediminis]|uniref:Uncharacterized protein n=1 Tax=Fodinibius sediminis TaxID=1214077 RepID=A0A521FA50_9BACT|nr:hypothetical protein [Fodinibius sediminis]SMO92511.1 hypothetical protein SAMN06265218_12611 [Fodinibius sediminis]
MRELDLFGEKKVDEFRLFRSGGRVILECTVVEKWGCIIDHTLSCGNEWSRRVKRTTGISQKEIKSLEVVASTSLGFSGIAELKASINSQTTIEYGFETLYEEEDEYSFSAPDCGSLRVLIYQKYRLFQFNYTDTRWLHGDQWRKEIKEWIPKVRDESKKTKNIPNCGCSSEPEEGIDGLLFIEMDNIEILEGYIIENDGKVLLQKLNKSIQVDTDLWPYELEIDVSSASIPDYLLYFTFERSKVFRARITPIDIRMPRGELVFE